MKRLSPFLLGSILAGSVALNAGARSSFTPGEPWSDVKGSHINAHGCCVVYDGGTYYWFGEDRTGSTSNGISCYTSTNLYDWTRHGLVFKASQAFDPETGKCILERPKVVYNEKTGKWVMYIHWENGLGYGEARVCVASADKVDGDYQFESTFRPNGHDSRDQTVVVGPDGKGYHICATGMNTDINIALLSDDFLTTEQNPVTETQILKGRRLEAPAVVRVGDTYFALFSECSGWDPNPGHSASSTDILGEWEEGPNFAIDNGAATTYRSQSTYILKVADREGAYIYMGDRWNKNDVGGKSEYVWLPLSVRSGFPTVKWHDSWDLSVFDNATRFKRIDMVDDGVEVRLLDKYSDRWVSSKGNGYFIDDDNDATNVVFRFEATSNPYVWHLADVASGLYLESTFGSLKLAQKRDDISQEWRLELLDDGCYKIQSCQSRKVLTVSGSSQLANSAVFMAADNSTESQRFGLYFDSLVHDYEAADMFSKGYREDNLKQIALQQAYESAGLSDATIAESSVKVSYEAGQLVVGSPLALDVAQLRVVEPCGGRVLFSVTTAMEAGETVVGLPASLPEGVYICYFSSGNGASAFSLTRKFIVR